MLPSKSEWNVSATGKPSAANLCNAAMLELGFTEELRKPLGASRIAPQVVAEAGPIEKTKWAADARSTNQLNESQGRRVWKRIGRCLAVEGDPEPQRGAIDAVALPGLHDGPVVEAVAEMAVALGTLRLAAED